LLESIFVSNPDIHQLFEKELGKEGFKKLTEKKYVELEARPGQTSSAWDSLSSKRDFEEKKVEQQWKGKNSEKNFDAQNKFEFPGLERSISGKDTIPLPPENIKKKKIGTDQPGPGTGWQKSALPYGSKTANLKNDVELKKKVEDDFPTIAGGGNIVGGIILILDIFLTLF